MGEGTGMIGVAVTTVNQADLIREAKEKAAFKVFSHGASAIRKTARTIIAKSEIASEPGQPIHTRRGLIPNAIVFNATKRDAFIGPLGSRVGESAHVHEFGGEFRGDEYPERSFMEPAMMINVDRFAEEWEGSIGR